MTRRIELTERPDALLSSRELGELLGVSGVTLSRWRSAGRGPAYMRLSKTRAAYRMKDVRAWLDAQTVQ